jgi:alpha/beta superfamily hydrolase
MKASSMLPTLAPGTHAFFFEGKVGRLEAELSVPQNFRQHQVALIGHPHSLQGGSMTNKVVTTLARAFAEFGIPSLRFNFRGVGKSEGSYDDGFGESEDMIELAQLWSLAHPETRLICAGFSFGSFVAYRAARQLAPDLLISVAPPVNHYDFQVDAELGRHWFVLQGDEDEVVPLDSVLNFSAQFHPPLPVIRFSDTGHFFHGKLILLRDQLMALVTKHLQLP